MEALKRIKTGVPGFDELIEGGIPETGLIILAGHCGSGRSTFAMQYLYHGAAEMDEPGVYISLEKEPEELIESITRRFGWDIASLIKKKKLSIIRPDINRFEILKKTLEDEVDRISAKRVVINPFSSLAAYFASTFEARKALADLRGEMKKLDCTALAITDIREGEQWFSSTGFEEFVVSGVIVFDLALKKETNSYTRTIFVRKMEETNHSLKLTPIEISEDGIHVYHGVEVF